MKISYYPGCTLKTKAKNLEDSGLAALSALGLEVHELERWNCCGAVFSLADDDLIHLVAPVRVLIRAVDAGSQKVVSFCSQCYNTLARANQLVREDEEKCKTLNLFMDEENDYDGSIEVVHLLELIRDEVGWVKLRERVTKPLEGLKVAPFYGCTLLRPEAVAIDQRPAAPTVMADFITAMGATPVDFPAATDCCGAYQVLANAEAAERQSAKVLGSARENGADAIVLSCPLCDYNLGKLQAAIRETHADVGEIPVYYFTQLLAIALGVETQACRLELNMDQARTLLEERKLLQATPA